MQTKRNITDADIEAAQRLSVLWEAYKARTGESQEVAGEKIGLSQAVFSQYLNAVIALNTEATLKFALLLGVHPREIRPEIDQLLRGTDVDTITPEAAKVAKVFDAMPDGPKQETLDFILYKIERSEEFVANDAIKTTNYIKMIEQLRSDLQRRKEKRKRK